MKLYGILADSDIQGYKEPEPKRPGFGLTLKGFTINNLNPKFEYRNSKQIRISNSQMFKT
jgi:hypothetical protein